MRCRDFGVGELVEPAGDADEDPIPEHTRERFRVNPSLSSMCRGASFAPAQSGEPIRLRAALPWTIRSRIIAQTTIAVPASMPSPVFNRRSALSTS